MSAEVGLKPVQLQEVLKGLFAVLVVLSGPMFYVAGRAYQDAFIEGFGLPSAWFADQSLEPMYTGVELFARPLELLIPRVDSVLTVVALMAATVVLWVSLLGRLVAGGRWGLVALARRYPRPTAALLDFVPKKMPEELVWGARLTLVLVTIAMGLLWLVTPYWSAHSKGYEDAKAFQIVLEEDGDCIKRLHARCVTVELSDGTAHTGFLVWRVPEAIGLFLPGGPELIEKSGIVRLRMAKAS